MLEHLHLFAHELFVRTTIPVTMCTHCTVGCIVRLTRSRCDDLRHSETSVLASTVLYLRNASVSLPRDVYHRLEFVSGGHLDELTFRAAGDRDRALLLQMCALTVICLATCLCIAFGRVEAQRNRISLRGDAVSERGLRTPQARPRRARESGAKQPQRKERAHVATVGHGAGDALGPVIPTCDEMADDGWELVVRSWRRSALYSLS